MEPVNQSIAIDRGRSLKVGGVKLLRHFSCSDSSVRSDTEESEV